MNKKEFFNSLESLLRGKLWFWLFLGIFVISGIIWLGMAPLAWIIGIALWPRVIYTLFVGTNEFNSNFNLLVTLILSIFGWAGFIAFMATRKKQSRKLLFILSTIIIILIILTLGGCVVMDYSM